MNFEPSQGFGGGGDGVQAGGQVGAGDDDDRNAEAGGGGEFGHGRRAAGVLGHHDLYAVLLQQGAFGGFVVGAAGGQHEGAGRGGGGRVDRAEDVVVLRRRGEWREVFLADGEEDAAGYRAERVGGFLDGGDFMPGRAGGAGPGGAVYRQQRRPGLGGGGGGVVGHLRGEGVGGVEQGVDLVLAEVGGQAVDAAEAADAAGDRLRDGVAGAAGERQGRVPRAVGERAGQAGSFGGAAEDQDVHEAVL